MIFYYKIDFVSVADIAFKFKSSGELWCRYAPISARSLWSHAETLARLLPRSLNKDGLNKEGGEEKFDNIRRIIRLALFALAPNCFRRVALLFALLILSLRSHGFRHARSRSTSAFASTSLCPRSRWSHALRSLRSHTRFACTLARTP